MVPEIKSVFHGKVNGTRTRKGLSPFIYLDDYKKNPLTVMDITEKTVGTLNCETEIKHPAGKCIDATDIAYAIFDNIESRRTDFTNDKNCVAYDLKVEFEDGYIKYVLKFNKEILGNEEVIKGDEIKKEEQ